MQHRETKADRNVQTLTKGLRAAHQRMFSKEDQKRPKGFSAIYSDLEDALYSLYSAIQQSQFEKITRDAGDIIVLASIAVEKAEEALGKKKLNALIGGNTTNKEDVV